MHRFGIKLEQNLQPKYNIAPTHSTLVIRPAVSAYDAMLAQFGLPAHGGGKMLINARSETVTQKPTFVDAFRNARCLVLSDGWYEWDAARTPYHIHLKDKRLMAMAGLLFKRNDGFHFTIMTGAAQGELAALHHRTPLVLRKDMWWRWLTGTQDEAMSCLTPPSDSYFGWHEVSKAVGKVSNDSADLMQPVAGAGVLFE